MQQDFSYEFTKLSFENLNRHIRLADNKAKFLLSFNLATISGIIAVVFQIFPGLTISGFSLDSLIVFLFAASILILFISFFNTVLIISPRLIGQSSNPSKLLYWGQVSKLSLDELRSLYQNSSKEQMKQELYDQIYFYSLIATAKYKKVRYAIHSTLIAAIFAFTAISLFALKGFLL